ncbi:MAG: leucine-rich repeat domain-containing protein, partial [Clostridiales bacterium]|nr:leucine-rich repeat domain-containing protein [Clostridiales bacterium]
VSTGEATFKTASNEIKGTYDYVTKNEDIILFIPEDTDLVFNYFRLSEGEVASFVQMKAEAGSDYILDGEDTLISYVGNKVGTASDPVTLPATIKHIAPYAFAGSDVAYINFTGVETIGAYAFMGCTKLESVVLPAIVEIGTAAFVGTSKLTQVTLGSALENVGLGAFAADATDSLTVIFQGTTAPKFAADANATMFNGRKSVTLKVNDVDVLLAYWAEPTLKDYAPLFKATNRTPIANEESYYGVYFNSNLSAVVIGETVTVDGFAGVLASKGDNPYIYVYDAKNTDGYREVSLQAEAGKIKLGDEYYYTAPATKLVFTSEEGETLSFTIPADQAVFAVDDAEYTPKNGEKEEVFLIVVTTEAGVEAGFYRFYKEEPYLYSVTFEWNQQGSSTFKAEYEPDVLPLYNQDYLLGETDKEDKLDFYFQYGNDADLFARGEFESILDKNEEPLKFKDQKLEIVDQLSDGTVVWGIEFEHTDRYLYSIQIVFYEGTFQGQNIYIFFYYWTRSEKVELTSDNYTVNAYLYEDGNMFSDEEGNAPAKGELLTFELFEGDNLLEFKALDYDEVTDTYSCTVEDEDGTDAIYTVKFTFDSDNRPVSVTVAKED